MQDNGDTRTDQQSNTDSPQGEATGSDQSGSSSEQATNSHSDSTKDAASGNISEVKARDPEYYTERDIPSE